MLHSVRRALNCPKEYTSLHLRRQVLFFICEHAQYYMNSQPFIEALRGTYGWDGEGVSLVGYVELMLDPNAWGDEIFLTALSHMWGCSITIMYPSEGNREWRIRHDVALNHDDFAFIYTGGNHYSPIGKHSVFDSWRYGSRQEHSKKSSGEFAS